MEKSGGQKNMLHTKQQDRKNENMCQFINI